ncbi:hypothetical protein EV361DRAFT_807929, partial [Lentinula raphanica]
RIFLVLHPSLKSDYLRKAGWRGAWINDAINVTRETWQRTFKPTQSASPASTFSTPEVSHYRLYSMYMNSHHLFFLAARGL